ncbi:MFS transporter [Orrella sp. NBD-18]|uniref:MFS transporter n=1 Tax=Sheuella amnicola TaxID=2707330 RepID=A0A6B2R1M1_9BURK|nr:MFS transporter [Sheuella amnicola]NDY84003.1 MFS transporter [Sheuella amnicola]HBI83826.1 MFS transporter [Alcaligenaceae bacterium]
MSNVTSPQVASTGASAQAAALPILIALSFCHLLNDLMQSLIPALYPLLKEQFALDFTQIGIITLAFQITASLLQPTVGFITDKRPQPFSLAFGMCSTLLGLLLLSVADNYALILIAASLVGTGSAIFHPEASRVARMASGGMYGSAQAFFQVGGNLGQAVGPLLAAFIVLPRGQGAIAWVSLAALVAMMILTRIGLWYRARSVARKAGAHKSVQAHDLPKVRVLFLIGILMLLLFSKNVYSSSLTSFFTFYLIERFDITVKAAQIQLFIFMSSIAVGTLLGGALTDRIGRRPMIWISILGALPFTLMLPYADLFWTAVLTIIIGLLMASAFPAILVYAHELIPGRVGLVSGLFFGFAFGLGGLGAAGMGYIADFKGISFIYQLCSYLPALGIVAWFLPDLEKNRELT